MHFRRLHFLFDRFCSLLLPLLYTSVTHPSGTVNYALFTCDCTLPASSRLEVEAQPAYCLSGDFQCRDSPQHVP